MSSVGELLAYRPDPQDWGAVMSHAGRLLLCGSERDNGKVDYEWASDQLGMQYELRNCKEEPGYVLTFWQQFTDPQETCSSIGFADTGVDALFGPICSQLDPSSGDATFEAAEMSLRFHLSTAPIQ